MAISRGYGNNGNNIGVTHHLHTLLREFEFTPLRVAVFYLILGMGALYLSDVLFVVWFADPLLSRIQAIKGMVEVVTTAGLFYVFTTGSRYPLEIETDRLERQREELQVLHRVMRHNLRNDLNVIMGYVDLIKAQPDSPTKDQWCEKILDGVSGLMKYTEKAQQIEDISDPDNPRHARFDLAETIPTVLRDNPHISGAVNLSQDIPDSAPVEANHMLDRAIEELVTNAIQHNDAEQPAVSITVDQQRGPIGETQLLIEDNGPGIHRDTLNVLEESREDPLLHMDGLGLWMVYWTVMASNGRLNIEVGKDRGTRVELTLPKALDLPSGSMAEAFA